MPVDIIVTSENRTGKFSAEVRRRFLEDGVVCLRQAFDRHWLAVAADIFEQGNAARGPLFVDYSADTRPETYFGDFWIWHQVPAMRRFIFESPAPALAGGVMDVNTVMLVTDNWLVREAGTCNHAPWHHDGPYFDLDGQWCVLWMSLERVEKNEGVVFVKGSHRWKMQFMPESFTGSGPKATPDEEFAQIPDFSGDTGEYQLIGFELDPGDCLIFDSLLVHGALKSVRQRQRSRRLTMRFADGEATYRPRGPWTRDMTDILETEYGLKPGGPLRCDLLPLLWTGEE